MALIGLDDLPPAIQSTDHALRIWARWTERRAGMRTGAHALDLRPDEAAQAWRVELVLYSQRTSPRHRVLLLNVYLMHMRLQAIARVLGVQPHELLREAHEALTLFAKRLASAPQDSR